MDWQPISTAPKNGRAILWAREDWDEVGNYYFICVGFMLNGRWHSGDCGLVATHWMPLPPPPASDPTP